MFTLVPDRCENPSTSDEPMNNTMRSYVTNDHPTCSDGCIPTFCKQGCIGLQKCGGKARDGVDTSRAEYAHFVALPIICNGLSNFFGNQQDTTDVGDGHQEDSNDQDWNDEDWSYNGCMFTIGTSGERVRSDCAMRASCNGLYERECASTGSSTDDPNYSIRVDVYGFSYNPVGLYCFPPGLAAPLTTPVSAKPPVGDLRQGSVCFY